jgi:hypothetical protein
MRQQIKRWSVLALVALGVAGISGCGPALLVGLGAFGAAGGAAGYGAGKKAGAAEQAAQDTEAPDVSAQSQPRARRAPK